MCTAKYIEFRPILARAIRARETVFSSFKRHTRRFPLRPRSREIFKDASRERHAVERPRFDDWHARKKIGSRDRNNFTCTVKTRGLADRGGGESENAINPTTIAPGQSESFSDSQKTSWFTDAAGFSVSQRLRESDANYARDTPRPASAENYA